MDADVDTPPEPPAPMTAQQAAAAALLLRHKPGDGDAGATGGKAPEGGKAARIFAAVELADAAAAEEKGSEEGQEGVTDLVGKAVLGADLKGGAAGSAATVDASAAASAAVC